MHFQEKYCKTDDDVKLYYRAYGALTSDKPSILCLPGLTRNHKSFHHYALYCQEKYNAHLICPDMRGRGLSEYDKNPMNYNLMREVQDIMHIIHQEALNDIIIFGTSRGGMQSCMLAPLLGNQLKAVILNDIGIQIPMSVMGALQQLFMHQTDYIGDYQKALNYFYMTDSEMTKNLTPSQEAEIIESLYHQKDNHYYLDYDYKGMGAAFEQSVVALKALNPDICDLSALMSALNAIPTLLLHGENSKLLTTDIVALTKNQLPNLIVQTIKDRGHCPYLHEPDLIQACDAFLQSNGLH